MHMSAVILIDPTDDPTAEVERLLADHKEWQIDEDTYGGWWDWYRIGGRWDGTLHGSNRHDGCEACAADGGSHHYADDHEQPAHNIVEVRRMPEYVPFRFMLPDGQTVAREEWDGNDFVETPEFPKLWAEALLSHRDCLAVIVDYHS